MILRKAIYILVILSFSLVGYTQENTHSETTLFYRSELYGGALVHTNGWGVNIVKSRRITGFKKRLFSAEIVGMKHPKEDKRLNPYDDSAKRYVYGKLSYFTVFRPSIGKQKVLFTKRTKKGVQIGYSYLLGASIGLARPVYLEVAKPSILSKPPEIPVSTEKYDPDEHNTDMILGRASYFRGIENSTIYPGGHAKFGLNFEYASEDNLIRSIETGFTLDAFYKTVPIMAFTNNNRFFVAGYVSFQIGKKSIE